MEQLFCPPEIESATGVFDPAGYDTNACAGCGAAKELHIKEEESGMGDRNPRPLVLRTMRERTLQEAIQQALFNLEDARPKDRNGPRVRAIAILRKVVEEP